MSATIGVTVHREESKSGPSRKSRRSAKAVRPDADEREVVLSHRFLPFQRTLSRFEKENSCVDFLFDLDRYFSTVVSRDISKGTIRMFFRIIFSSFFFLLKGILVDSRRKRKKFYRMEFIILNEEDYYSAEYR